MKNNRTKTKLPLVLLALLLVCVALTPHTTAQTPLQTQMQPPQSATIELTAQVTRRKLKQPVENLTAADFRLFENEREQRIKSVTTETRPLSIVVVAISDKPGDACVRTKITLPQLLSKVAFKLPQATTSSDRIAVVATDQQARFLHRFDTPLRSLYASFEKAVEIFEQNLEYPNSPSIGVKVIERTYLAAALKNALEYLADNKRTDEYRIVLFVGNARSEADFTGTNVEQMLAEAYRNNVTIAWFANYEGASGTQDLPRLTGGEMQSCELADYSRELQKTMTLEQAFAAQIERMRTRYRIVYQSTNTARDNKLREIRLELTNKALTKGNNRALLFYPKFVAAPQN